MDSILCVVSVVKYLYGLNNQREGRGGGGEGEGEG